MTCFPCKTKMIAGADGSSALPSSTFLLRLLVASMFVAVVTGQDQQQQEETTTTICSPASNTFTAKVNFHQGHVGYFTFAECGDNIVSPTIGLRIGETYTFHQGHVSNWYHPMGFAYGPDGALDEQDELEPGITRNPNNSACAANLTCPTPLYKLNDEFLGNVTVPEDFGLDNYEPQFFLPLIDWIDKGTFTIDVTFDDAAIGQDAFYFCHIHQFMSGRIKFLDATTGEPLVSAPDNTPALGYEYDTPGSFDRSCGTVGLDLWQLPNPACPDTYVCGLTGKSNSIDADHEQFAHCLEAVNCRMQAGMTTGLGSDVASMFAYHMIPHHENAVDMAKALLYTTTSSAVNCPDVTQQDDTNCVVQALVRDIINTQNLQIQTMRRVLAMKQVPPEYDCTVPVVVTTVRGGGRAA